MMKKRIISSVLFTSLLMGCLSLPGYTNYAQVPALTGNVMIIPLGTQIPCISTFELNSENMTIGQPISLMLSNDFYYSGKLIAPAGSVVNGSVIQLKKAGFAGINGNLKVRFTHIITTTGQTIPISGIIKTDDGTGLLVGGTKMDSAKEYVKDMAIGAGAGALAGVIISPISGGKIGRGTALGTAVGAGGGLVKSLVDKGANVCIPANSKIDIILDQPITYTPASRY